MTTVFDDTVHVHYSQIYVTSDPEAFIDGFEGSRAGQSNGLCGAATPGLLYLVTGLHTGDIPFTVEVHESAPPVPDGWEDVVEASFRPVTEQVELTEWAGEAAWPLPLRTVDYRVRYCVTGMDEGRHQDTVVDGEQAPDRYLLQFWPGPPAPDVIVRQGSESAAYWHGVARRD